MFKYSPSIDAFHVNKHTTPTTTPLYELATTHTTSVQSSAVAVSQKFKQYEGWSIHDWVFPQTELMRYLGRRTSPPPPTLATAATRRRPDFHPTLHCSALRFMDDGRCAMAAIQRDHIGSSEEYPSSDINYPFNPDSGSGSGCPAGYYRSGNTCVPITSGDNPNTATTHLDPITGEVIDGAPPTPNNGSGEGHVGGGDNFNLSPSWSRIVANTSGRSLVLLWSDAKAVDGKAKGGRALFEAEEKTIDGSTFYTQNWTYNDTWWSGSRISYWYQESGQRAIPITYGSYPEVRCSYANLPRCLPHLFTDGVVHGTPSCNRLTASAHLLPSGCSGDRRLGTDRYDFLRRTRFVPTTIGFADFGAGANPHQEMGWSGWSFPQGLYDPIGFGNTVLLRRSRITRCCRWRGHHTDLAGSMEWLGIGGIAQYDEGSMSSFSHHGPLHYGHECTTHSSPTGCGSPCTEG